MVDQSIGRLNVLRVSRCSEFCCFLGILQLGANVIIHFRTSVYPALHCALLQRHTWQTSYILRSN